jgi:hypothetical protein
MDTNGLGNFKVLLQGKNVSNQTLWGFESENTNYLQMQNNPENVPILFADETYMPLLSSHYPHSQFESRKSWMDY